MQEEDCSVSEGLEDYDTYYSFNDDDIDVDGLRGDGIHSYQGSGDGRLFNNNDDPEYFAYECLTIEKVEKAFDEQIAIVCSACKVGTIGRIWVYRVGETGYYNPLPRKLLHFGKDYLILIFVDFSL